MTARKSATVAVLHGDRSRSGRLPQNPPQLQVVCPGWLDDAARAVWAEVAPTLPVGTLTAADVPMFGVLCTALARYREAAALIARDGVLIPGARGVVKHPAAQLARDAAQQALALSARFGLTPVDRDRLRSPVADSAPGADLLS